MPGREAWGRSPQAIAAGARWRARAQLREGTVCASFVELRAQRGNAYCLCEPPLTLASSMLRCQTMIAISPSGNRMVLSSRKPPRNPPFTGTKSFAPYYGTFTEFGGASPIVEWPTVTILSGIFTYRYGYADSASAILAVRTINEGVFNPTVYPLYGGEWFNPNTRYRLIDKI